MFIFTHQADGAEQSKLFVEVAKELGAAKTDEEARKAFRKVVEVTKPKKG